MLSKVVSALSPDAGIIEQAVGNRGDFNVGDRKEVVVGSVTILLVCSKLGIFALGNKCTHYGAPLIKGVLDGCRIKCPWHAAVFDIRSGDVEESPAINALPSYPLRTSEDGTIYVKVAQTEEAKKSARQHVIPSCSLQSPPILNKRFVIVGGGSAALGAIDTLKQEGFQGEVIMITQESYVPYDRTRLSKDPTTALNVDKILLRSEQELLSLKVVLLKEHIVTKIDTTRKQIEFQNQEPIKYDEVLVATGSRPRKIPLPGSDLKNVFYLRSPPDAAAIATAVQSLQQARLVIIGTGFIGLELAAWLTKQKEHISTTTLLTIERVPLEAVFGKVIGKAIQTRHEKEGINFLTEVKIDQIQGNPDDYVKAVQLNDGRVIPTQIVVIAVGAQLNTEVLKHDPKINLSSADQYAVIVDDRFRNSSGIYAAGDIASFPYAPLNNQLIRVEHWAVAQQTGRLAAYGMMGLPKPSVAYTPIFWTVQYGSIRYCGYGKEYDDVLIDGDLSTMTFIAFYTSKEQIRAVVTSNKDPMIALAAELISTSRMPTKQVLQEAKFDLSRFV